MIWNLTLIWKLQVIELAFQICKVGPYPVFLSKATVNLPQCAFYFVLKISAQFMTDFDQVNEQLELKTNMEVRGNWSSFPMMQDRTMSVVPNKSYGSFTNLRS